MWLTNFPKGEKTVQDNGIRQSRSTGATEHENAAVPGTEAAKALRGLTPGQTIRGEVLSRTGNEIQLRIAEDLLIHAKLERGMNLDIGKAVTFEVKNNGNSFILSPLFENTAADANVLKALDMASLPVNERSVAMTELLMKAGFSVDKNTLQQIYREVAAFTKASVMDIVNLHRLGVPVTESSLEQMASYNGLSYRLGEGFLQLGREILPVLSHMIREGNVQGAAKLWNQLFSLIMEGEQPPLTKQETAPSPESLLQKGEGLPQEGLLQKGEPLPPESLLGPFRPEQGGSPGQAALRPGQESVVLAQALEAGQGLPDFREFVAFGEFPAFREFHGLMNALVKGQGKGEALVKALTGLLEGKAFQEQFARVFAEKFTLTPKEVSDPHGVEEFYEKTVKQLRILESALEEAGGHGAKALQSTGNLSRSLDFLQQINQTYLYIQLPLKLGQRKAHGDLCVFTNKKHLAREDGKISALLHLSMEHLGDVDVYVAMEDARVSTKFYVPDESILRFLEGHMELLTKRLQKRGYECTMTAVCREDEERNTGLKPFLQKQGGTPLVQYAFDMRA